MIEGRPNLGTIASHVPKRFHSSRSSPVTLVSLKATPTAIKNGEKRSHVHSSSDRVASFVIFARVLAVHCV